MKKLISILVVFLITLSPCFSTEWKQITDKKYMDVESIDYNDISHIVSFWVKNLRSASKDKINGKDYWYYIAKIQIKLPTRQYKITTMALYDLKNNLIETDNGEFAKWEDIIPDTYMEGYYKIFKSYYNN